MSREVSFTSAKSKKVFITLPGEQVDRADKEAERGGDEDAQVKDDGEREEAPQEIHDEEEYKNKEDSDSGWDTDLEDDEEQMKRKVSEIAIRDNYEDQCRKLSTVPVTYFLENISSTALDLGHHGIGERGILPMMTALTTNTNVQKLDLMDNSLRESGAEAVARMLHENLYISEVNIAANSIASRGALAMGRVIKDSCCLKQLNMAYSLFTDKDAEPIADGLKVNQVLKDLCLSHNSFQLTGGEMLAEAIAVNEHLEHLDLSWNHLRLQGAIAIANAMAENNSIRHLNLAWNGFADEGAAAMGKALASNTTLLDLDLSSNRITKRGALEIAKGLQCNNSLRVLKIGHNPIEATGAHAILLAIKKNDVTALRTLLMQNVSINKECEDLLEDIMKMFPDFKFVCGYISCSNGSTDDMDPAEMNRQMKIQLVTKIKEYLIRKKLRAVDLFNCLDKDKSMSVSKEEFYDGIKKMQLPLTEYELLKLIHLLDVDGDGEIDYQEFAVVNAKKEGAES